MNKPDHSPKSPIEKINGVKLHYLDWGGEGICIVLLAGFSNSAHIYKSFAANLKDHFRVVALTRRSHGQSEITETGYDLNTRVEDIRCFLEHLEVEGAVLVGHSMAGDEITRFSERYPGLAKKLVYLDAAMERSINLQGEDPLRELYSSKEPEERWGSVEDYFEYYREEHPIVTRRWDVWRDELLSAVDIAQGGEVINRFTSEIARKFTEEMQKYTPDYTKIECPALSFYAMANTHPRLPKDASRKLTEAANSYYRKAVHEWKRENANHFHQVVKDSKVVEVPGAGHYVFLDKEEEVAEQIKQFILYT